MPARGGRGLGALGDAASLEVLRTLQGPAGRRSSSRRACEIAIDRIEWENSEQRSRRSYGKGGLFDFSPLWGVFYLTRANQRMCSDFASVDPAPPLPESQKTVEDLEATLMDTKLPLFQRYRAMFALRDLASPPDLPPRRCRRSTRSPAGFADASALFRHEIAFVFGQLSASGVHPALTAALSSIEEASMVRHEAAEALGEPRRGGGRRGDPEALPARQGARREGERHRRAGHGRGVRRRAAGPVCAHLQVASA